MDSLKVWLPPKMHDSFPLFLSSFGLFLFVHQVLAPIFSALFFPSVWGRLDRRGKNNWSIHVVSQVHALIVVPLALRSLEFEELEKDRAFGWHPEIGTLEAVACGYFLWDTLDSIVNFVDLGFVLHGIACLSIYWMSYKPFLAYYAARCLLWETSTIFLNNHWFLDKTNRTGSLLQLVNGVFLLSSFLGVRLIYGGMISYDFFYTLYSVRDQVTWPYLFVYGVGNILLQGLNWLWFMKMIAALRKRFLGSPAKANGKQANGRASRKVDGKAL